MTTGSIYTTGGTLVEGQPVESDRIESLVEDLGVLPPWQACYYVPEETLIHIVTARRRDPGAGTRKADNYYFVLEASSADSADLWNECQQMLESRFEPNDSPWETVAQDDHKSELSSPEHIYQEAALEAEPQTLAERGIAYHLQAGDRPLRFGFSSAAQLRTAVRRFDTCGAPILYATDRKATEVFDHGLEFALDADTDFEPVDADTVGALEEAMKAAASDRREAHVDAIKKAIEAIADSVETDDSSPTEVIPVLEALRSGETAIDAAPETLQQSVDSMLARREQVAREAVVEPVGNHGDLATITSDHVTQFDAELTAVVDNFLSRLKDDIITKRAHDFEHRIHTEIAGHIGQVEMANQELEEVLSQRLSSGDSHSEGSSLVDIFTSTSSTRLPAELAESIDTLERELDDEIVPELADMTGVPESQIQSRFREAVEINVDDIDPGARRG